MYTNGAKNHIMCKNQTNTNNHHHKLFQEISAVFGDSGNTIWMH